MASRTTTNPDGTTTTEYYIPEPLMNDMEGDDMMPIPKVMQPEGVEFCDHDLLEGKCYNIGCKFYAPHDKRVAK